MKNSKKFFSEEIFQENFSASVKKLKKIFQREDLQENFLVPFAEGAVKNFTAGVGSLAKKAKEVEEDARRRFCDYPSA
jgi:hypothetical protein